ncbi:unnamed protein product [Adineta steineri]|uniref:NAD(P)(+)--arginine ADP-ribosyltransferase n=1 Tax=Adineta steineri TaxID=433720 RepID=A0A819E004_9BILA|nr:unnamed protein product [Adineta steineri]CAF3842278.1 unnamed protein product [Adineta steineri]
MSSSRNRFTDIELENKHLAACDDYINYKLLSLEESMKDLENIFEEINRFITLAKIYCSYPNEHNLTKDESAAIYIYMMEISNDSSIYRILNETLHLEDRSKVFPWFGYLKLLHSAISKLPKFQGTIFRGINKDVTMTFEKDQRITWWGITSCSTSIDIISSFLNKSSASTLFHIDCLNGRFISSYTCYSNENEVILMPETILQVVSINPLNHHNKLSIIHLKENNNEELSRSINLISTATISENPRTIDEISIEFQSEHIKTKFQQFGITVAGGNGKGDELNQLSSPLAMFVDSDKSIYIADGRNARIVKWEFNSNTGQIMTDGNENNKLKWPVDIIFDKKNNSFVISDLGHSRIIRSFGQNQKILFSNIDCHGLTIDKNGFIYVCNHRNNEIRRHEHGDTIGELIAGGNGRGNNLNQLNEPRNIFIDEDSSLYISDSLNHRIVKWKKDAKEGIIVAGGNGQGKNLNQLSFPQGVIADHAGQIYVADSSNHRIMRWCEGDKEGEVVVGGNGEGIQSNQLNCPRGLSFDNEEYLYVLDQGNHRIQRYKKRKVRM